MFLSPSFVTPAIFKPGSTVLKNVDSRLKISGMTEEASPLNGSIDYKGTPPPHKPPEKTKTQKKKRQKKTIINNPEEKTPYRHS